jgi:hypothetical protein
MLSRRQKSSRLGELPWRVFGRFLVLSCKRATVNVRIMRPRGVAQPYHVFWLFRQQGDKPRASFLFYLAFEKLHDSISWMICELRGGECGRGGDIVGSCVELAAQRELLGNSDATVGWRGTSGGQPDPHINAEDS